MRIWPGWVRSKPIDCTLPTSSPRKRTAASGNRPVTLVRASRSYGTRTVRSTLNQNTVPAIASVSAIVNRPAQNV
jgi:hypothetical protein